jgi:1,2-phenylacetyl-CoA epoxidase PaaB subunit
MATNSNPADVEWSVALMRGSKLAHVGEVTAPDEKTALETAKRDLPIPATLWDRVVVKRA